MTEEKICLIKQKLSRRDEELEMWVYDFNSAVELSKVDRLEVINETGKVESHGRVFSEWNVKLEFSVQDNGKTLKIFVREPDKELKKLEMLSKETDKR